MSRITMLALACSLAAMALAAQVKGGGDPVPEAEVGLSKTPVMDIPTPEATLANSTDPGEQPPRGAPFPEGPPPISHGVVDFLPITFERNDCVDCHAVEEKVEGEATPMPVSHYTDLRAMPVTRRDELVGARYNCMSCHVVPGANPPLVKNDFGD